MARGTIEHIRNVLIEALEAKDASLVEDARKGHGDEDLVAAVAKREKTMNEKNAEIVRQMHEYNVSGDLDLVVVTLGYSQGMKSKVPAVFQCTRHCSRSRDPDRSCGLSFERALCSPKRVRQKGQRDRARGPAVELARRFKPRARYARRNHQPTAKGHRRGPQTVLHRRGHDDKTWRPSNPLDAAPRQEHRPLLYGRCGNSRDQADAAAGSRAQGDCRP